MNSQSVKVWDPLIRIFHWSLVATFAVSYLTGESESPLHTWSGYAVLGLIAFRLVWGLVGTRHARFSDFVRGPRTVLAYAKSLLAGRPRHYLGHNPLGGAMIVALILSLLGATVSGLALYGAEEGKGPLAPIMAGTAQTSPVSVPQYFGHDDEEREEVLEEVHEFFANFTLILIFLHVAGVVFGSIAHRENLVRAMITGRKRARQEG